MKPRKQNCTGKGSNDDNFGMFLNLLPQTLIFLIAVVRFLLHSRLMHQQKMH